MKTQKYYKYRGYDEGYRDLSHTLGITPPSNGRMFLPLTTATAAWSTAEGGDPVGYHIEKMEIEYGTVGFTKRHERIVKTEKWGDNEVHFIEYWYERYQWWQPVRVDGKRIDGI